MVWLASHGTTTLPQLRGRECSDPRRAGIGRGSRRSVIRKLSVASCRMGIHAMCRSIKTLYNFEPPVTEEEIRAASLQFVRKITGFNKPSKANEAAFAAAVDDIAATASKLLTSLETTAAPKNREEEAAKARVRGAMRFRT